MAWVRDRIAVCRRPPAPGSSPPARFRPWGHGGLTGLDRAGGGLGIGRVGLAAAAGLAVGSVDLDHDLAVGGQEAGQGGTVGAGAVHAQAMGWPSPRAQASRS